MNRLEWEWMKGVKDKLNDVWSTNSLKWTLSSKILQLDVGKPRESSRNQIDFIMKQDRLWNSITSYNSIPGVDCGVFSVVGTLRLKLERLEQTRTPSKLQVSFIIRLLIKQPNIYIRMNIIMFGLLSSVFAVWLLCRGDHWRLTTPPHNVVAVKLVGCHSLPSVALVQGKVTHSLQQPQYTKYTVSDRSNQA